MAKLIGQKKIKTAVFISGKGSNLKNLIKFSLSKKSPIKINLIVSDNSKSEGLKFANKFKLKKKICNYRNIYESEKKILKYLKEKFSGCTVHFVNSRLDSGKIIIQKKVRILSKDTPKTLAKRILKHEHIIYPKAILKIFSNS